jgi:hypothetical protein
MRIRQFPWLELAIVVLSLVALAFVAYGNYRRQQAAAPYFDTFSTYDARHGGYRAWFELLKREGVGEERFELRPAFLDASISTLILAYNSDEQSLRAEASGDKGAGLNAGDLDALARWVKAGGRLVWITDGSLVGELQLPPYDYSGPQTDAAVTVAASVLTQGVDGVSGTGRGRVPFKTSFAFAPLVADDVGAVVLEYRVGRGAIVVVTDQTLFNNAHLAKADNARLAYNVAVAGGRERGLVAFDEQVHGFVSGDSWWTILPVPVRIAAIIVAVALLLLVLGTAFRFGPTARLPQDDERTSAEYLTSMATLFNRGGAARKAVRDLVDIALREVASAVGLPEKADAGVLAARLRTSPTGAENADLVIELDRLRGYLAPAPKELVRAARLCAALRKEYSRYGRFGFGRRGTPARRSA